MTATPAGPRWRATATMATTATAPPSPPTAGWRRRATTGPCASMIARPLLRSGGDTGRHRALWPRLQPGRATGSPSAMTTRPRSRWSTGTSLTPLPGPDTGGHRQRQSVEVAWSADGATLYAGGTYDDGTGVYPVLAWPSGGQRAPARAAGGTQHRDEPAAAAGRRAAGRRGGPLARRAGGRGTARWAHAPPQADSAGPALHARRLAPTAASSTSATSNGAKSRARFDPAPLDAQRRPAARTARRGARCRHGLTIEHWINS